MRYLRELVLPDPAIKVILEDYLMAISAAQERIQRCERAMIDRLPSWRLKVAVDTLMAFKGFQLLRSRLGVAGTPPGNDAVSFSAIPDKYPFARFDCTSKFAISQRVDGCGLVIVEPCLCGATQFRLHTAHFSAQFEHTFASTTPAAISSPKISNERLPHVVLNSKRDYREEQELPPPE
jgi:hypothetical protein